MWQLWVPLGAGRVPVGARQVKKATQKEAHNGAEPAKGTHEERQKATTFLSVGIQSCRAAS